MKFITFCQTVLRVLSWAHDRVADAILRNKVLALLLYPLHRQLVAAHTVVFMWGMDAACELARRK